MKELMELREDLGTERAGDPLCCGDAYQLICSIEEELTKLQEQKMKSAPKKPTPTNVSERSKFQVGDTVSFDFDGALRIVLRVGPGCSLRLMNVPSHGEKPGFIQESCNSDNYTLVYRPGESVLAAGADPPCNVPGGPKGGLKEGDVLIYSSPCYGKRINAIFIGQTPSQRHSGWIEAYRLCDGKVSIIDLRQDDPEFRFRPGK